MRNTLAQLILVILLGAYLSLPLVSAQQSSSEEVQGQQAEQAGRLREALTHYVAALQGTTEGSDAETRLQERIINVALKLKPPPTLPADAIRFEGRAEAAVHAANNANDFLDAAKEYKSALRLAPWNGPDYFNLAVVLEKAGRQSEAIQNYKLYLLAAPDSQDSVVIEKKIGELEYQIDRAAQAAQAARDEQIRAAKDAERERNLLVGPMGSGDDHRGGR